MKTISDLNALIPQLKDLVLKNAVIGDSICEITEDGIGGYDEPISNSVIYEEDGWNIEIVFDCSGEWESDPGDSWTPSECELLKAWGEVTEIFASYYDEDTEEETVFGADVLNELWSALDKALENIA